tara:strand:- start:26 stop:211 length:186 start_codon:yes stop_codon:yes gene_type:complete
MNKNEISNAYFNVMDIENTLDAETKSLTRRHGGTQNEDTVGDLIHDIKLFLEELEREEESK